MRVLIIHQHFRTPTEGGGIRSFYLAKALHEAGHSVEVLTAGDGQQTAAGLSAGFQVHYLPVRYDNSFGFYQRISSFLRFIFRAWRFLSVYQKPDIIYAISTPLSVGWLAMLLKRQRGIPYIFEIGDLWPAVPVQMGYLKNRYLIRWLQKLEWNICNSARAVVAMSHPIYSHVQSLGFGEKTVIVTNFSDIALARHTAAAERTGATATDIVLAYTGAIGRANRLLYMLNLAETAEKLQISNFKCVIMGNGAEKDKLRKLAADKQLKNVTFLAQAGKEEAFRVLKAADVAYLSFDNFSQLWTGSPNKYFDALALGKPVLCNFGGWIATELEQHRCGFSYNPENPHEFFEVVWPALVNDNLRESMAQNALRLAQTRYSLDVQIPKWLELFRS